MSPIYLSFGYVSEFRKYVGNEIFVYAGSNILILLILFILDKLGFYHPRLRFARNFNDFLCVKSLRYNEINKNHHWLISSMGSLLLLFCISGIIESAKRIIGK